MSYTTVLSGGRREATASQCEEFVDAPLVVGVLAVIRRDDSSVAGDQKICRNTKLTACREDWRDAVRGPDDSSDRAQENLRQPDQQTRIEQRPRGPLDTQLTVDLFSWIGDQGERQFGFIGPQLLRSGVEDNDLPDAGGRYVISTPDEGPQVQIADGTAGEASELQVDGLAGIRDRDCGSVEPRKLERREGTAGADFQLVSGFGHGEVPRLVHARPVAALSDNSIGNTKWIGKTKIRMLVSMTVKLTPKGTRTRQRIVDIAAELMFERGVTGATLEDVKAAAGVSSSQLYHYFEDKPALVRAVIEQQTDDVVGAQEPVLAEIDSIEGLRAWRDFVVDLERQLECRGGCPIGSLGSQLAEIDPSSRSLVSASFIRWETALQGALRSMHERGRLNRDADPDALSLALLVAVQGGLLLAQIHRSTRPLENALDTVLDHIATHTT